MGNRSRRVFKRSALLLAGLLLGLVLAEIVTRLAAPQFLRLHVHPANIIKDQFMAHDRLGKYDELLGWRLRPQAIGVNRSKEFDHEIRTNSHGFRDDESKYERGPAERRIVLFGDSFAMGWGVRRGELFADLLEEILPGTEVINLSVSGYGTDQEVLLYENEGSRYEADIVLLALLVGNDITDNIRRGRYNKPYFLPAGDGLELHGVPVPYLVRNERKVPVTPVEEYRLHDWLDGHSSLYALVFHHLARVTSLRQRWLESGLLHRQVLVFGPQQIDVLSRPLTTELEQAWQITERLLLRWRDAVCERQAVPVLLIIPSHLQVYPEIWREVVRKHGLDARRYDRRAPHHRLVSFCAAAGLPVLDLLPPLEEAALTSLPLYYRQDPHWTAAGHHAVARSIAEFIEGRDLACPIEEH